MSNGWLRTLVEETVQLELPLEEWRDMPGYEGSYQVSDMGRVRNIRYGAQRQIRLLNPYLNGKRYFRIRISRKGQMQNFLVHRLVMAAFVGKCPEGYEVNHKNGVATDNRLENLEYVTRAENMRHMAEVLKRIKFGEDRNDSKLTESNVIEIRMLRAIGMTLMEIASRYGVSAGTISSAVRRVTWKHIK